LAGLGTWYGGDQQKSFACAPIQKALALSWPHRTGFTGCGEGAYMFLYALALALD